MEAHFQTFKIQNAKISSLVLSVFSLELEFVVFSFFKLCLKNTYDGYLTHTHTEAKYALKRTANEYGSMFIYLLEVVAPHTLNRNTLTVYIYIDISP